MSNRSEPTDALIHGYRLELSEIPCIPGVRRMERKGLSRRLYRRGIALSECRVEGRRLSP